MSASFQKQKQQQSSQSTGSNVGINGSTSTSDSISSSQGTSFGTSTSTGVTGSSGITGSTGTSGQTVAFQDLYAQLFGNATTAAGGVDTGATTTAANTLFGSGTDFLSQLTANPDADALRSRLTDTTSRDANLDVLKTGLTDLFNNTVNPAITAGGVSSGTLGGGRTGVAQGMAADALGKQYATGAASIIGADQTSKDTIAGQLAQLTQGGAATGLAALPSLLGIKTTGDNAGLDVYSTLSKILGGPTTLTSSDTSSFGTDSSFGSTSSSSLTQSQQTAMSIAQALSDAFGYTFGEQQSTSQGTGSSMGISGGFGGSTGFGH